MRTRLLPLLIVLLAGVLLALGFPLAVSVAAAEQQDVIVDRIDDTARFAALAQSGVTCPVAPAEEEREGTGSGRAPRTVADGDGWVAILRSELDRYHDLYGIRVGVYCRDATALAAAPRDWRPDRDGEPGTAFREALAGRRSHDSPQVWPWQRSRLPVASPIVRDGDVVAVVVTDSPTDQLRSRVLKGWLLIAAGEAAAMLLAVAAAFKLTGWVLRPVRILDKATHDISTGRMKSRVATAGGPPELRRLGDSFNEMADHVEQVLEQQRAFVADASHQLRNPLAALLLRIDLLAMELPENAEEIDSLRDEGRRLAQVLDDLLGLALAEHATADPHLSDVAALAAERVAAWRAVAQRARVELTVDGPAALTGWADPIALSSALDAVIDNGVKFTPEGGRVTVTVEAAGDTVTITVADTGPGLTEDELARVGDRFWRSGRHQNVSGSGLGLSIARALLTSGGASLEYQPNTPRGLRVRVTVPRTAP